MRTCVVCLVACVSAATLRADLKVPVDIPTRAQGAERVVVAKVLTVNASFATTEHGDQIIISHVDLLIDETLKGSSRDAVLSVDVEGGTVGDLTLNVSDMPGIVEGERGVFFLRRSGAGKFIPHLRGQGIIKLQSDDRVRGTSLTLDAIRNLVRGQQ